MARTVIAALGALGLSAVPACSPAPQGEALELLDFPRHGFQGVALNEELRFYFSGELERTALTSESVRILDDRGALARGALRARGSVLSFLPDLAREGDLSDGGFRPGTAYRVILAGFPRPDGIRSRAGALLSATLILTFHTAERGGEQPLFLDPFSGPNPLLPATREMGPEDPIRLECREALDPTTVSGDDFELRRAPPNVGGEADLEVIPLEASLAVNLRDRAVLELRAGAGSLRQALEPGETYYLAMIGRGLKSLGGRSVEPGWRAPFPLQIRLGRLEEDFSRTRNLSPEAPAGCDGTAAWIEGVKGVRLRYPAAAGSGEDGVVELRSARDLLRAPEGAAGAKAGRARTQAVRLTVPADAVLDLGGIAGPVVLCSQTSLEIPGRIVRHGGPPGEDELSRELENRSKGTGEEDWQSLSSWLERALASSEPWTILITGGDLRVPAGGLVEVDGPLMLVAGGWIRVEGDVEAREVWKTPEGGGNIRARPPARPHEDRPGVRRVPLKIDPPPVNRLRSPLRLAVLSRPVPVRVASWRPALLEGHEGIGRVAVRFLGRRGERGSEDVGPWEELSRLEGCTELRFRVELEVPSGSGEPWDPPRLERLSLSWSEPALTAERSGETPP